MREKFYAFHEYEDSILDDIWGRGLIVFDTNTLLNMYKMSLDAQQQFIALLNHPNVNERLWMPYQVGEEFHRNREFAIKDMDKNFQQARKNMISKTKEVSDLVNNSVLKFHQSLAEEIDSACKDFEQRVTVSFANYTAIKKWKDYSTKGKLNDTDGEMDAIAQAFNGKIGERIPFRDQLELFNQAEFRFEYLIPPGYKDRETKVNYQRFGDFVLWTELLKTSKKATRPVIFVTEDRKKDWWESHDDGTHQPLPGLLMEFHEETGQYIYISSYKDFVEVAQKRFKDLPESGKATVEMEIMSQETGSTEDPDDQFDWDSLFSSVTPLLARKGDPEKLFKKLKPTLKAAYQHYLQAKQRAEQALHYATVNGRAQEAATQFHRIETLPASHQAQAYEQFTEWVYMDLVE